MDKVTKQELKRMVTAMEQMGCACDLLYGVVCGIHAKARETLDAIDKLECQ